MANSNQMDLNNAQAPSPAAVARQRDFLLQLRQLELGLLKSIAQSDQAMTYLELLTDGCKQLLPDVDLCLLWCDKDMSRWRVLNHLDWQHTIVDAVGDLKSIPKALTTFVASPSRPFAEEQNLITKLGWEAWHAMLTERSLQHGHLVSIRDGKADWLVFAFFYRDEPTQADSPIQWFLDQITQSIPNWVEALVIRQNTDLRLQKHTDELTGLLLPHAFNNALSMMLRDARRYFLRLAFVTVIVHEAVQEDELKLLSDTLRDTLRDNDLLACFGEQEFVMAMRIGQLDDAEIVAGKIMTALQKADPNEVSVLDDGVSIGVAFYPEQADQNRLYLASKAAAAAVTEKLGYRLEYYGKFVQNLDEAYQD